MKSFSHYLNPVNEKYDCQDLNFDSREDNVSSLLVNCAGYVTADYSHTNNNPNGRLDYYLIYLVSGEIEFIDGDKITSISQGNLIIYPPKTPYKYRCIATKQNVTFYWVHFTGKDVLTLLEKYKLSLFPKIHKINVSNRIDARFKSLFDAFALKDGFRDDDLAALCQRVLIEIGRVVSIEGTGSGRLHKSVRYLNENFTEAIKIGELAKMENMCMTTFNLHFKKYVGTTPTKYIIKLRMQQAVDLLLNSELSIQEIASRCGYNDYNFFTKVFKGEFGVAPSKYRKDFKR